MKHQLILKFFLILLYNNITAQELFPLKVKGKWGLYNELGKKKVALKDYKYVYEFKEGMAMVTLIETGKNDFVSEDGTEIKDPIKIGFINEKGEEIVPAIYDGAEDFYENVAIVYRGEGKDYFDRLWRIIKKNGEVVQNQSNQNQSYEQILGFSEGLLACSNNYSNWIYIDKNYNQKFLSSFEGVGNFYNGIAMVQLNKKWGFIDTLGTFIIPNKYNEARDFYYNNYTSVKLNDKWGLINKNGKVISPFKYDYIADISEGKAIVVFGKKSTFIDTLGNELSEAIYNNLYSFNEGLAGIQIDKHYGFIDMNNQIIIKPKYYWVSSFKNNFAVVNKDSINKKYCYINKLGKEITTSKYGFATQNFYDGNAIVVLYGENKGYGVIDITGKEIISATEENEQIILKNGFFIVVKKDGTILRFDKKGNLAK
jgi:hypothetical protein